MSKKEKKIKDNMSNSKYLGENILYKCKNKT